jgi:hypothetical protein
MLTVKEEHGLVIIECTFTLDSKFDRVYDYPDIRKHPVVARWLQKLEPYGEVTLTIERNMSPLEYKIDVEIKVPPITNITPEQVHQIQELILYG